MNKTLIRAAAVINIVAASLIYVSCSGDDGKDGKDGCLVAKNAATGLFDITCNGSVIVSINQEGAVAGPPGEACTAVPKAYGADILCGSNAPVPIYNGEGAGPGGGGCSITPIDAPVAPPGQTLNGDKVINLVCPDGRSASILVCPVVDPTSPNGATALLFNTDGQLGRCRVDGTITRTEQATLNCGGTLFDEKKSFCQRTFTTRNSTGAAANDSGFFVEYNKSTGIVSAAVYPTSYNEITDAESAYNMAGGKPNVTSRVMPLCGVDPDDNNSSTALILSKHVPGGTTPKGANTLPTLLEIGANPAIQPTVYNALQHCGRNLVFKIGDANGGNASDRWNGEMVAGGQLDKEGASPSTKAWSVQTNGQCYVGLKETNLTSKIFTGTNFPDGYGLYGFGINGFTFTGTATPGSASATCDFFGAVQTTTVPPYSSCPEGKILALDDVGCVDRSECMFHSTIDNTCLVDKQSGTLFGKTTYDSAYIILINPVTSAGVSTTTAQAAKFDTIATFRNWKDSRSTRGIYRTFLGSRYGRGTGDNVNLNSEGNMWSKECKTTTAARLGYYAVNDPYLTNKRWKDGWAINSLASAANAATHPTFGGTGHPNTGINSGPVTNLSGSAMLLEGFYSNPALVASGGNGHQIGYVPPPICGGPNLIKDSLITAVPFDDAFACISGELSVYYPATAATNDGNAWNRPIYCVQTNAAKKPSGVIADDQYCYISASLINNGNCKVSAVTSQSLVALTTPSNMGITALDWSSKQNACQIKTITVGGTATPMTAELCATITKADVPRSVPVIAVSNTDPSTSGVPNATHGTLRGTWNAGGATGCVLTAPPANMSIQGVTTSIQAFDNLNCGNISTIKQTGGTTVDATGAWVPAGGSVTTAGCVVTLKSEASLETVCSQIEVVNTFNLSTTTSADLVSSYK
jgi:hypothetical protein